MGKIENIEKIRLDDKVITEGMSPQDVWNLSGQPVRVKTVRWTNDGKECSYSGSFGITVATTSDRTYIAVAEAADEAWTQSRLLILNGDGTVRMIVSNVLELPSGPAVCNFVGVTSNVGGAGSSFTAIAVPYMKDAFSITQRVSIDAETGHVLSIQEAR